MMSQPEFPGVDSEIWGSDFKQNALSEKNETGGILASQIYLRAQKRT